jgi:CDP-6-deoxy-D-xylo-4-hexulose-3-dehydrase
MAGSDEIMNSTLFLGTYPGLTESMLAREVAVISTFVSQLAAPLAASNAPGI